MEAPPVLRQAQHALSSSKGGFEPGMEVLQKAGRLFPKPENRRYFNNSNRFRTARTLRLVPRSSSCYALKRPSA